MRTRIQHFLIAILIFSASPAMLHAQSYTLGFGLGMPESMSLEASVQGNPIEFKLGVGGLPLPDDKLFSLHGDIAYHFGKFDDDFDLQSWFGRGGLIYFKEERENWIDQYAYFNLRVGRVFSFNENWGIEFDFGLLFELYYDRTVIQPSSISIKIDFPILPSLGARIFYRI